MSAWDAETSLETFVGWLEWREPSTEAERQERRKREWSAWGIPAISIGLMMSGGVRDTSAKVALTGSCGPLRVLSAIIDQGKTVAAAWWLVNSAETAPDCVKTTPPLFLPIRAFARKSWFDGDTARRIERAQRLVLDDLGDESLDRRGGMRAQVDALIDARYADLLPTVITTNLSAIAFARRYGPRALRRIHERGQYIELATTERE